MENELDWQHQRSTKSVDCENCRISSVAHLIWRLSFHLTINVQSQTKAESSDGTKERADLHVKMSSGKN